MILKCTTLASTVTILDLTGMVRLINAETYASVEFFLVAGATYLLLNGVVMAIFGYLEKKLLRPLA
jgi:ABC-type arginine/histidine transport system permease subunit